MSPSYRSARPRCAAWIGFLHFSLAIPAILSTACGAEDAAPIEFTPAPAIESALVFDPTSQNDSEDYWRTQLEPNATGLEHQILGRWNQYWWLWKWVLHQPPQPVVRTVSMHMSANPHMAHAQVVIEAATLVQASYGLSRWEGGYGVTTKSHNWANARGHFARICRDQCEATRTRFPGRNVRCAPLKNEKKTDEGGGIFNSEGTYQGDCPITVETHCDSGLHVQGCEPWRQERLAVQYHFDVNCSLKTQGYKRRGPECISTLIKVDDAAGQRRYRLDMALPAQQTVWRPNLEPFTLPPDSPPSIDLLDCDREEPELRQFCRLKTGFPLSRSLPTHIRAAGRDIDVGRFYRDPTYDGIAYSGLHPSVRFHLDWSTDPLCWRFGPNGTIRLAFNKIGTDHVLFPGASDHEVSLGSRESGRWFVSHEPLTLRTAVDLKDTTPVEYETAVIPRQCQLRLSQMEIFFDDEQIAHDLALTKQLASSQRDLYLTQLLLHAKSVANIRGALCEVSRMAEALRGAEEGILKNKLDYTQLTGASREAITDAVLRAAYAGALRKSDLGVDPWGYFLAHLAELASGQDCIDTSAEVRASETEHSRRALEAKQKLTDLHSLGWALATVGEFVDIAGQNLTQWLLLPIPADVTP